MFSCTQARLSRIVHFRLNNSVFLSAGVGGARGGRHARNTQLSCWVAYLAPARVVQSEWSCSVAATLFARMNESHHNIPHTSLLGGYGSGGRGWGGWGVLAWVLPGVQENSAGCLPCILRALGVYSEAEEH